MSRFAVYGLGLGRGRGRMLLCTRCVAGVLHAAILASAFGVAAALFLRFGVIYPSCRSIHTVLMYVPLTLP